MCCKNWRQTFSCTLCVITKLFVPWEFQDFIISNITKHLWHWYIYHCLVLRARTRCIQVLIYFSGLMSEITKCSLFSLQKLLEFGMLATMHSTCSWSNFFLSFIKLHISCINSCQDKNIIPKVFSDASTSSRHKPIKNTQKTINKTWDKRNKMYVNYVRYDRTCNINWNRAVFFPGYTLSSFTFDERV